MTLTIVTDKQNMGILPIQCSACKNAFQSELQKVERTAFCRVISKHYYADIWHLCLQYKAVVDTLPEILKLTTRAMAKSRERSV